MTRTYETTVEYDDDFNEYRITFPDELLENLGWEAGDILEWHTNKDGTVLVERIDDFGGSDE